MSVQPLGNQMGLADRAVKTGRIFPANLGKFSNSVMGKAQYISLPLTPSVKCMSRYSEVHQILIPPNKPEDILY
jgi:hypothetical protein